MPPWAPAARSRPDSAGAPPDVPTLEFFNGLGGFTADGEEYVTILNDGQCTPAPWINVVANAGFGFQVSADGSGSTWSGNSRENRLTPSLMIPVGADDQTRSVLGALLIRKDEFYQDDVSATKACHTLRPSGCPKGPPTRDQFVR